MWCLFLFFFHAVFSDICFIIIIVLFILFIYHSSFIYCFLYIFFLSVIFSIIQHIWSRRNRSGRHSLRELVEHGQGRCCGTGVFHSGDEKMETGKAIP